MRKTFLLLLLCISALSGSARLKRPKLIVGLVVDQMRWDYLYYYYDQYGDDGLKRLLREGYSCENTMINYMPAITAVGHASIYSGTVPALHGIAGNDFEVNGRWSYCCADSLVQSVGSGNSAGKMSPRNLMATTLGDMLRIATDYKSRVFGVALKDRAAILPAGLNGNAAYWWDQKAGCYVSSTYYMDVLPRWVQNFNAKNHTKPGFDIKTSNEGVTMTFKMAEALLENEKLGQGDVTDMLCVSVSSTDAIGHTFSTRGKENYEVYMRLDKDLGHFLNVLDEKVGKGNYLLFLTADHGAVHNPIQMTENRMPVEGWDEAKTMKDLNACLYNKYGVPGLATRAYMNFIYLNHAAIRQAGLKLSDVRTTAAEFLKDDPQFMYAFDLEKVATETLPEPIKERAVNSYCRNRSGDLAVVLRNGFLEWRYEKDYKGTTHGQWNP
ncbi:MAG TPA: alkaline phosphatase family protein, partial [Prevotella sp.]